MPEHALDTVKQAIFDTGAGTIGNYSECCWQTLGEGQFRPNQSANPAIGAAGELAQVAEYKVELLCSEACITAAVAALRAAHPYEEPAYDVIAVQLF